MLRVLVAEDSATARLLIVSLLSSDPEISVVGQAKNGAEAVALHEQLAPDVVTMDIQMPVMDGIEATRQIVARSATPVIMVSSLDPAEVGKSMLAFNAGALAVLAKPSGPGTPRFEKDCRELIATVKALSDAKAATGTAAETAPSPPPAPVAVDKPVRVPAQLPPRTERIEIIGVVASTGGPLALRAFFKALPVKCKAPIVIVQHIASGFAGAFAGWLQSASGRTVRIAVDQEPIAESVVYVTPDDRQLSIVNGLITLSPAGAQPSGTVMLASLAKAYGARAAGVILTGTGTDGVEGLVELRDAGGAVFAQDEASATTFETPRAAMAAGAITETTPINEIAQRLAHLVAGSTPKH